MKKLWLFFPLLLAIALQAQNFEGTITWSMKYDVTDPATKANMDKTQQSLNDPANQAKLKKMQEQMNTPEMKAMMDANPQMKAQMETALKALQGGGAAGGGGVNAMMPSGFTVRTNGKSSLVKMEGGMMAMEVLYLADKNQSYKLDRTAKTYSLLPSTATGNRRPDTIKHTISKTSESQVILGYNCTKYIVSSSEGATTAQQYFWTTNDIKGLDMKSLSRQRMGGGQSMYYEGIGGVPLKMEMKAAKISMTMEATGIKKESLPANLFSIPTDFKEVKGYGQ